MNRFLSHLISVVEHIKHKCPLAFCFLASSEEYDRHSSLQCFPLQYKHGGMDCWELEDPCALNPDTSASVVNLGGF